MKYWSQDVGKGFFCRYTLFCYICSMEENQYKEKVKSWLGRIFSMQTLGLLVAIASLLVGAHQLWLSKTGEPAITWEGSPVEGGNYLCTYVYTAEDAMLRTEPLFARIENVNRHSVRELMVKYLVDNRRVNVMSNSEYKIEFLPTGMELRNLNSVLPAFEKMNAPIDFLELHQTFGECTIKCRVTYNGIETPIEYSHRLYVKKMGKKQLVKRVIDDFLAQPDFGEDRAAYIYDGYDYHPIDVDRVLSGVDLASFIDSLNTTIMPIIEENNPGPPQLGVLLN